MSPDILIFDEEKDAFKEVGKITSKDVAFIIINQRVYVWQGKESSHMWRYRCGMKVTSLVADKRYLGFKHVVVEEGSEPAELQEFLATRFGARETSITDLAKSDRQMVQDKVREISKKYAADEPATPVSPASLKPVEDAAYTALKDKLAAVQAPPMEVEASKPATSQPATASVHDEIRRMSTAIGKGMIDDGLDLDRKGRLSPEERQVYDELRREQARADVAMTVEQARILHEERHEQVVAGDLARKERIEEEKRKVETMERERIVAERAFLEDKLRKEKEVMERDRADLERRLQDEAAERARQQDALDRAREDKKNELIEFELRKIDLRMQVRKRGVDGMPDPPAGGQVLYRIEQGIAVPMTQVYLTTADTYLLDKGAMIYAWRGKGATLDERFFGEEIAKLLKERRGEGARVEMVDQGREPMEFLTSFPSLRIMDGDFGRSVLKKESLRSTGEFLLYRISTKHGLLFQEMPWVHASITSNDSFLFDSGERIIIWHGRNANPEERRRSEEIAKFFDKERGDRVQVEIIEETNEPAYDKLPHAVWNVLKGEAAATSLKQAYDRAIEAMVSRAKERELKQRQEAELKRLDEERRALDEMERIEREMLEKEIDRKKHELTPQQIEERWRDFRRKCRVRRGLPEEEPEIAPLPATPAMGPAAVATPAPVVEDPAKVREQRIKEFEQLKRIELEMLEKKIAREQPPPARESELRSALERKMQEKWDDLQKELGP